MSIGAVSFSDTIKTANEKSKVKALGNLPATLVVRVWAVKATQRVLQDESLKN